MRILSGLLLVLVAACGRLERAHDQWVAKTQPGQPEEVRRLACVELGRIGGDVARDRLLELLKENTKNVEVDGPIRLYAAVGLTLLKDPGTAIDLLLALSTNNPDDNIAAIASEERAEEYFTIDAQICDALLTLGLFEAEEELLQQLGRRHRVRVLIDAYAVLRRHTGKDLPFRYNGSYPDRKEDAERWRKWLRETRAERSKKRPFAAHNARFAQRCRDVVADLGQQSVNYQLIAHKVLVRVGDPAVPFLLESLRSKNRTAQRQAALALGRIGSRRAAPALRKAVGSADADVRKKSLDALRKLGDTGTRPLARAALADRDPGVRAAAADFLGRHGTAEALKPLQAALQTAKLPATRTSLLCALARLGDAGALDPLREIAKSGEQLDREAAQAALEEAAK